MSADLTQARIEAGDVLRVERFGTLIELTVALPHLAATAKPGQFAQLRCGDGISPLLRRPFSVAWIDEEECSFVFEVVGQGTRLLASLEPGDTLDVLGPLGTGFTLEPSRAPVVVSGGVGCAQPCRSRAVRPTKPSIRIRAWSGKAGVPPNLAANLARSPTTSR